MESKTFRWWMLLIPVLMAVAVLTAVFWDAISIRIAPKAVLTKALTAVFSQLDERFREDPLRTLVNAIEPEGRYTADVQLIAENKLLGPVSYDMKVQTDVEDHQFFAEGVAAASEMKLNLSWYMDEEFMAVSSDELVNGTYYGITYDTFSQDIRSIPLLNFFISDRMLSQWDGSIQNIREQINRSCMMPQIPEISEEELHTLLIGILALPCGIEETSISVGDSFLDCHALSYKLSGEQVDQFLAGTPYSENATMTVTFYLYEKSLVKAQVNCVSGSKSILYALLLGLNPAENALQLQGIDNNDGAFETFLLTVDTQHEGDHYIESWRYSKTATGTGSDTAEEVMDTIVLDFDYQPSSGSMTATFQNPDKPVEFNFLETENGFRLQTDQFALLMQLLLRDNIGQESTEPISCSMTVSKGSEIQTPAYRNLDQWSLEDFWSLLSGVGALIGIQLEI